MTPLLQRSGVASLLVIGPGISVQPGHVAQTSHTIKPLGAVQAGDAGQEGPMISPARPSDRVCASATMIGALTSALAGGREPRLVREKFEDELRSLIRASSVTFREGDAIDRANVVSFAVPVSLPDTRPRLEAVFDPCRPPDDRAREMLAAAAQVAGLLLEIERARGRSPLGGARSRGDGAAPLIGSSQQMRAVRDRIEKVAATDFTVLIEGGIDPQE